MSNYYFLWLCTEQWELIYYVAFIVLTIGLVIFAAKTYFFQTKQSTKLFCKSIEKLLQAVIAIYISKCITTVILWHRISV